MPDLPIFVTATMARVPKSWQPCGSIITMADGSRAWLLVAPLSRLLEMQALITQGV